MAKPASVDYVTDKRTAAPMDDTSKRADKPLGECAGNARAPMVAMFPWLWPLAAMAETARATAGLMKSLSADRTLPPPPKPEWASRHSLRLELPTMELRDFSTGGNGPAALVCAPFALHGATIADFAPGHSVVEALQRAGLRRAFVTDWRSATPAMKDFTIDTYLADLNVAVDEFGEPVDLIGLCQGGWLALVYAARFPAKVRRLVLAGVPIDVSAAASRLSELASGTPVEAFEQLVRSGDGLVLGRRALELWTAPFTQLPAEQVLQIAAGSNPALEERYRRWYDWTVDLPGTYYLQVVHSLYKENEIARAQFTALGRRISPAEVRVPLFLLAARDDEVVAPEQLFAAERLVGTPSGCIARMLMPCGHMSLFIGADTLRRAWPEIAAWLRRDVPVALAS